MLDQLSIIIPTRNEAPVIGRFLAALPAAVELIVVDASSDATPELVKQLRPQRTQVLRSMAHIAAARQLGAQAARGAWLLFSDADVAFAPGYFGRMWPYLAGDAFYGPKQSTAAHRLYDSCFNQGQRLCHALGLPAASGSNMAVRREVFFAIGGFRPDLPVNEDTELFLRLAHRGYHVRYAPGLAVHSLDDRRLRRGALRKMLHSVARGALIVASLHVPLPQRWLRHDWGYWQAKRET